MIVSKVMVKIGIIGGSGLDDPNLLEQFEEKDVDTIYGKPSSVLTCGKLNGIEVVILARHGRKHTIMPTNVPNQANIQALKEQGCSHIIATSACGSLKEEIKPGEFIILDQFIDRTTKRKSTFFEQDHVCHIPMDEPFCADLRTYWKEAADTLGLIAHWRGTVITIEGPRFSTRAESLLWQKWNGDVINMSTVPECILAREAGICYSVICMATDYDCFKEGRVVNIEEVLRVFQENSVNVKKLITTVIPLIKDNSGCRCKNDVKSAVIS
jgi:5'-methylthioadenosine phosphorylase